MKKLLLLLLALLIYAIPVSAGSVTRYSPKVPDGSVFTSTRDGWTVELRSLGDEGVGTLPLVVAPETTLTTSWRSGGVDREVKTTRRANEGGAAGAATWARRHLEAEQAALQLWPPDPPQTGFLYLRGGVPHCQRRLVA